MISEGMTWDKNDPNSMVKYIKALEADYFNIQQHYNELISAWHRIPALFKFWI